MNRPPWGRVAPGVPQGQYAGGPSRASLCHAAIAMPGACAPPMVASQKPGANDIVGGPERQLLELGQNGSKASFNPDTARFLRAPYGAGRRV